MSWFRNPFKRKLPEVVSSQTADWYNEFEVNVDELRHFTPDMVDLQQSFSHPLFVADEYQSIHREAGMLEEEVRVPGIAYSQHGYMMHVHDVGKMSYPLIFEKKPGTYRPSIYPAPIRGELYHINPWLFPVLDKQRLNGISFVRKKILVVQPYEKIVAKDIKTLHDNFDKRFETTKAKTRAVLRGSAFTYFANPDHWWQLVNDHSYPVADRYLSETGLVKEYYHFNHTYLGPPWK